MIIERVPELDIDTKSHEQITRLRNICFPEHQKDRSYYKLLPHFRFLGYDAGQLIGHLAVDHRIIRVGDETPRILGVIDLCIDPKHRGQGLAEQMLRELIRFATDKNADFLLLAADDPRLYSRCGFQSISAYCSWLRVDDHRNFGVAFEELTGLLMVKRVGDRVWPKGPIDFLGYLF